VGFDAIVLAGGVGSRLGGADKAELRIGGVRLLDRVLDAVAEAERIVVVGPKRSSTRSVTWARESPPGGGPAAAIAAGLTETASRIVVVLAVDLPGITVDTVHSIVSAVEHDGAVLVDDSGRDQVLAAAYRRDGLTARLESFDELEGVALRDVVGGMSLQRVSATTAARDLDTWDDVAAARRNLGR
jgi:molybdopterin-guanine dinucleotide biosynthesis protein A